MAAAGRSASISLRMDPPIPGSRVPGSRKERWQWQTPLRLNATLKCSYRTRTDSSRRRSSSSRPTSPTPRSTTRPRRISRRWWESWAKKLDWFEPWQTVLDWNPPWAKWFKEGKLNVVAQLPRPPRRRRARATRSPTTGWARTATRSDVTYADLLDMTKRFANVLKGARRREGRRGRHLHADDPRDARRDARLRAHRRDPQRRLRRLLGRGRARAHGRLRGQGARHRRRFAAARQADADEGRRSTRCSTSCRSSSTWSSCDAPAIDVPDGRRAATSGGTRSCEKADADCAAGAARRRAPALHPLHLRLDRQAEGHPAHHRRLPDRRLRHHQADLRRQARHATSTGARPTSAGSPATPTSSTARSPTASRRSCTRAPRTTRTRTAGGRSSRTTRCTIMYTAPTAIRACIKWGREYPEKHDLSLAAAARVGRRADQPEGVDLVPQGDRRRALPDRRHLVADRDRPHHDHAAARHHHHQARLGHACRSRVSRRPWSNKDGKIVEEGGGFLTLRRPWPGMLRTLYKEDERYVETYWTKFGNDVYTVGDAAKIDEDGYFWIVGRTDDVINVSGHRMSTMEIESAIVSHDRVAEAAVIGAAGRGHRPGDRRVRDASRAAAIGRTTSTASSASTWPRRSASSRGRSASSRRTTCRRRAPGRSCAAC